MAKKKITLEEKLEEAIVKDAPYKVPENWVWSKLDSISQLLNGDRGKNYPSKKEMVDEGVPFINAGALDNGGINVDNLNFITEEKFEKLSSGKVQKDDILYCLRGTLGKSAYLDREITGAIASSLCIIRGEKEINNKYIFHLLNSQIIKAQQSLLNNGTAQPNLSAQSVKSYLVPIPPLKEQQRIVDKIESLFEKLDKAKELIEEARDDFEKRKYAILERAFIGELTNEYRKKFSLDINEWKKTKLSHFTEIISGNAFKSNDFIEKEEVKCVKITNVGVGYYENENTYLPYAFIDEFSRFKVKKNDILVSLTRSYINAGLKVCLYPYENDALLNQRVALIRYDNYRYLYYYLRSNKVLDYVKEKSKTTNQPNLSIKELQSMEVPIPSSNEQNEIVRILDKLLEEESKIEELTALEEQIELIKKSILAKAFRGQLGTNCKEDETALELLKEILNKK